MNSATNFHQSWAPSPTIATSQLGENLEKFPRNHQFKIQQNARTWQTKTYQNPCFGKKLDSLSNANLKMEHDNFGHCKLPIQTNFQNMFPFFVPLRPAAFHFFCATLLPHGHFIQLLALHRLLILLSPRLIWWLPIWGCACQGPWSKVLRL